MENEWEERSFYATNLGIQSNGTKSTKQDCGSLMPKHHDCNKYFQWCIISEIELCMSYI